MQNPGAWEYHVERLPDNPEVLGSSMRLLSDAGWELVGTSAASAPVRQGSAQVWHVTHTLFWRRPKAGDTLA